MKSSKRKSVDRKNVAMMLIEPFAESAQRGGVGQFVGSAITQAQANRVRIFWTDTITDGEGVFLERSECLRPILTTMNIRAVGEVKVVV